MSCLASMSSLSQTNERGGEDPSHFSYRLFLFLPGCDLERITNSRSRGPCLGREWAMSTLLSRKRSFHAITEASPRCSPARINFLSLDDARRKRSRWVSGIAARFGLGEADEKKAEDGPRPERVQVPSERTPGIKRSQKRSRLASAMDTCDQDATIAMRKRPRHPGASSARPEPASAENPFRSTAKSADVKLSPPKRRRKTYTEEEVRKIVSSALGVQEEKLRREYDQILRERLAEQYESFTCFNQDHINHEISKTECSYVG